MHHAKMISHVQLAQDMMLAKQVELDLLYDQGVYCPLLLHHVVFLFAPAIEVGMMRRQSTPYNLQIRLITILWTATVGYWIIQHCRTVYFYNGFVIGLVASSAILRATSLLLFRDPETEFLRVAEHRGEQEPENGDKAQTTYYSTVFNWGHARGDPCHRRLVEQLNDADNKRAKASDFAAPMMTLLRAVLQLIKASLTLELLSIFTSADPYFYGDITADLHVPGLRLTFPVSSPFTQTWRTLLGIFRMCLGLTYAKCIFNTITLAFCTFLPKAGYTVFRIQTHGVWMYPNPFGPAIMLLDDGLIGAWGSFWHQAYRFDFNSCARFIIRSCLPASYQGSPPFKATVHVLVAFSLSGLIHALASYTQFAETNAFTGVGWFFLLQGFGAVAQVLWTRVVLRKLRGYVHVSRRTARIANAVFLFCWFCVTGPVLFDEYARGLLWVPAVSPRCLLQGLGMSFAGSPCVRCKGYPVQFWKGNSWWTSGIRLL
ncbi:membrane bound O-acyl transferase family-domain-containing protein [Aspergillus keveii]|uniref:Membrane bound O-acyl transferase family-domain-containing protein n=1 Tax=Aspergillus keveii TaxID=714993 RepID=A0ABR4GAW6_9EURO